MGSEKKLKITNKQIAVGIIVLVIVAVLAAIWLRTSDNSEMEDGYHLTVSRGGEILRTYSVAELEEMPSITVHASLQSSQKGLEEGDFKGVALSQLLENTDPGLLEQCDTFLCTAGDSYSSALTKAQVLNEKDVIVAYEKDGKALIPFKEGGDGPLRIIIASDTYGNRSTKFLVDIECR